MFSKEKKILYKMISRSSHFRVKAFPPNLEPTSSLIFMKKPVLKVNFSFNKLMKISIYLQSFFFIKTKLIIIFRSAKALTMVEHIFETYKDRYTKTESMELKTTLREVSSH